MSETTGIFLEYELAYRAQRLRGETTPRGSAHRRRAGARFLTGRSGRRTG